MDKFKKIALWCCVAMLMPLAAKELPKGMQEELLNRRAEPSAIQMLKSTKPQTVLPKAAPKKAVEEAEISDYANRSFYGGVAYMSSWSEMSITDVPYGLYSFDIKSNGNVYSKEQYTMMSADWLASGRLRDHYYGVRQITMFGALVYASYEEVNLNDFTAGRNRWYESDVTYALLPAGMFVDVTDGNMYGIMYNEDLTGLNVAKFNPDDMSFEVVCKFGGQFNVLAVASAPDGKTYLINTEGDLYTMNRQTGRVSLIDNTGVNAAAYAQAMCWDSQTGKFLWCAVTPTGTKLYAVDPETAETKFVADVRNAPQLSGMYMAADGQMPTAPKAVSDFKIEYDSPGSLSGVLSFTLPSTDGEGATINTPLTVSLWQDGEVLKDGEEMTAGEKVSIPLTLTNENHHFALSVKNEYGYAPMSVIYEWAGEDYPAAPGNVVLTVENNVATLAWEAPEGTAHGGYMDDGEVTYRIVRMPDNVVVAGSHTKTTFSEQLPKEVKRYYYTVTAVNGGVKAGEAAESNYVVAGEAYPVPYSENWADGEAAKELFVVINNDEDGYAWSWADWNYKWLLLYSNSVAGNNDDWLISPKVSLEAGKVYRFKANLRNSANGQPETFAMAFGTDSGDVETFTKFGEWSVDGAYDQDMECSFKIETTGDYHLALISTTNRATGSSVVLNSIGVELIGDANAPEAVTELTVTPDPEEKPIATIGFVLPNNNLNGETLTGTMSANIYRDNSEAVLATVENLQPGESVTWTDDTNPTAGRHTYTVRAVNEAGEGMPASATAFIGVYEVPWSQPCLIRDCLEDFTMIVEGFADDPLYPTLDFNSYGDPMLELTHFNTEEKDHDMWLMLPTIKFDDESVYSFRFNYKQSGSVLEGSEFNVNIGDAPTVEAQTEQLVSLPISTGFDFVMQDIPVVITEGGKKYLSLHNASRNQYDYFLSYYKDFSIERIGSALAPDSVTNLSASSELSSKIVFNAPSVDYAGRELAALSMIEIYRNGQPIAVKTFENPNPGELMEWVDEGAILGFNSYEIVATNEYGRGRAAEVKAYIGYDIPAAPADVSIIPSDDNQSATISWSPVKRGVNGGVLSEELTYKVVEISQGDEGLIIEPISENLVETTYFIDREPTDEQQLLYYGVVASSPQGDSDPGLYFTILGKPYELPFEESFANGAASSQMWLAMHASGALQSGPTVEEASVTMGVTPQDGDKGCFFFLNGTYLDYRCDIPVFTPKVTLGDAEDPEVSFYLYKGNHSGDYEAPEFRIYACYNEGDMELLGSTTWNETSPQWVRYAYSLKDYKGLPGALLFNLTVSANNYSDFIAMDNFKVTATPGSGIESMNVDALSVIGVVGGILTRGAIDMPVEVFTADGKKVAEYISTDNVYPMEAGMYVVRVSGNSYKVVVR